jgi:CTP:molybdopterin cytidylyltransferase MocA
MQQFKPMMKYKGKSFLVTIVQKLLSIAERIYIVTGFQSSRIEKAIQELPSEHYRNIKLIKNKHYQKGMLTSLQTGISVLRDDSDWVLYHFVDQPHLPVQFYSDFCQQIGDEKEWIQPRFKRKNGHPILLNKSLFESISTLPPTASLRDLSHSIQIRKAYWDCTYPQVLDDFNRLADVTKYELPNQ